MRDIDDNAQWCLNDLFMFLFYDKKYKGEMHVDEFVNKLSCDMLHLNRLMVAYTQYGPKSDIEDVFDHLDIKDSRSYYPILEVDAQWFHKAKNAVRELAKYIKLSAFRDIGLYLSKDQEENNHLNNGLREEYRSVVYKLLEAF